MPRGGWRPGSGRPKSLTAPLRPMPKARVADSVRPPQRSSDALSAHLLRTYGLERQDYDAMLAAQANLCAICRTGSCKLVVDHDHATGKVRGLLCGRCNAALGFFRDDSESCQRAAGYLIAHSETTGDVN